VLIQQYLDESYAVEYSIPSCRRLLNQAGLSYQNLARQPLNLMLTSNPFREGPEKAAGNGRHSSLFRSNREIRPRRAACHVVSVRVAAVCRIIQTTRLDASLGRDHRGRYSLFSRLEMCVTEHYSKNVSSELYNGIKITRLSFRRERRPSWHRSSLSSRTVTTLHSPRFRRIRRNRIQSGVVTTAAPLSGIGSDIPQQVTNSDCTALTLSAQV